MKKTLSLVLAAVLAFGTAVSAFAAVTPANVKPFNPSANSIYKWSSDNGRFEVTTKFDMNYGSTFGFMLVDSVSADVATKSEHVKSMKPYVTYQIPNSSTLVEKVQIEYKKFYDPNGTSLQTSGYAYFVTVKTKANTTAASADLYGEVYAGTSKSSAEAKGATNFTVQLVNNLEDGLGKVSYSKDKPEANWTIDFKDDNDVDIDFAGLAAYTVDATGQGKLNVGFSTKFNSEFSAKYPAANLEFLTWGAKPSFNRIGELTIYSEDGKYLYELTADGFKEPKYTYDEDYEAFTLKTRTLGSYVISDIELEPETVDEKPAPSLPGQIQPPTGGGTTPPPSNGGKPNPNTGR